MSTEQKVILIPMADGSYQIRLWGLSEGAGAFAYESNMGARACLALAFPARLTLREVAGIVADSLGIEVRPAPGAVR